MRRRGTRRAGAWLRRCIPRAPSPPRWARRRRRPGSRDRSGKSSSTALCTKPVRPVQLSSGSALEMTGTYFRFGISASFCLHPVVQVQIGGPAAAPVQGGGERDAFELHVLDHRLDRRETGARRQQDHRLVGILAQVEAAVGAFDAQDFLFLHRGEHMVGELAAGHVADVQFDRGRAWHVASASPWCGARSPSSSCAARRRAG